MSDDKKDDDKKKSTLSLGSKGTLALKAKPGGGNNSGLVQQSFSGGRSKTVAVEVRRRRGGEWCGPADQNAKHNNSNDALAGLSAGEREKRLKALEAAQSGCQNHHCLLALRKHQNLTGSKQKKKPNAVEIEALQRNSNAPKKTLRQREMEELQASSGRRTSQGR